MPNIAGLNYLTRSRVLYEVTIDNTQNPNDLTDYQVLIKIVGDTQFFLDAGDKKESIRLVDEDLRTPLDYFIEIFDTVNKNAWIWVKVPKIPGGDVKKVYISLNPERTEDLSNPGAVFDFFDHFEGNALSELWSTHVKDSYTTITVHDSLLDIHKSSNTYSGGCALLTGLKLSPESHIVHARAQRTEEYGGGEFGTYVGLTDDPTSFNDTYYGYPSRLVLGGLYLYSGENQGLRLSDTVLGVDVYGVASDYERGVWYIVELIYIYGTNAKAYFYREHDGHEVTLELGRAPGPEPYYVVLGHGDYSVDSHALFDYVALRKYTEPEPRVTYERVSYIEPFNNVLDMY